MKNSEHETADEQFLVIVCTRNRPAELASLLRSLAQADSPPPLFCVVDSSNQQIFEDNAILLDRINELVEFEIHHISSGPGLPAQRALGVRWAISQTLQSTARLFFFDDDITLPVDFFNNAREVIIRSQANFIGAWDHSLVPAPKSLIRAILGFGTFDNRPPYSVAKGGFTCTGAVTNDVVNVEWVPGHSFIITGDLAMKKVFNNQIRMTGEDLDYQIVSGEPLILSKNLYVFHKPSNIGRSELGEKILEDDLLRWSLAVGKRFRVRKSWVIVTTILLILSCPLRLRWSDSLREIQAHISFLRLTKQEKLNASEDLGFSRILG